MISRDGRIPARDTQRLSIAVRQRAVERYYSDPVERPLLDRDPHIGFRAGGERLQQRRQIGIVQRTTVDRDGDGAVIVAETLERGPEARNVVARSRNQRKGWNRDFAAQGHKLGAGFQRRIDAVGASRSDGHTIGLRVGGARGKTHGFQHRQCHHDPPTANCSYPDSVHQK